MAQSTSVWRGISPPLLPSSPEPPSITDEGAGSGSNITSSITSKKLQWKHPAKFNGKNLSSGLGLNIYELPGANIVQDCSAQEDKKKHEPSTISSLDNKSHLPDIGTKSASATDSAFVDPYSLPISPTLSRGRQTATPSKQHNNPSNPVVAQNEKSTSNNTRKSNGTRPKRSSFKQVAKKSFLDSPGTSQSTVKPSKSRRQNGALNEKQNDSKQRPRKKSDQNTLIMGTQKASEATSSRPRRNGRVSIATDSDSGNTENSEDSSGRDNLPIRNISPSSKSNMGDNVNGTIDGQPLFGSDYSAECHNMRKITAKTRDPKQHREKITPMVFSGSSFSSSNKKRVNPDDGVWAETRVKKKQRRGEIDAMGNPTNSVDFAVSSPIHFRPTAVHTAARDLFAVYPDEANVNTNFTNKLLSTTACCKPTEALLLANPTPEDSAFKLYMKSSDCMHTESSDTVAQQLLSVLESATVSNDRSHLVKTVQTRNGVWLAATDPYKEMRHVLGYFCKTILRFLKSKEAAISDVTDEYFHRGTSLNLKMKSLHDGERGEAIKISENRRLVSLRVLDSASGDIKLLAQKLKDVSLAPILHNILGSGSVFALQNLEACVM